MKLRLHLTQEDGELLVSEEAPYGSDFRGAYRKNHALIGG